MNQRPMLLSLCLTLFTLSGISQEIQEISVEGWAIQVLLPQEYQAEPERRFPVAYFFDGANLLRRIPGSSRDLWEVDEVLEKLYQDQWVKPMIVVAINRRFPKIETLVGSIVPRIDQDYRTQNAPEHRTIIGSSGGASYSLLAGLNYPKLFGNVGAMSLPAFQGMFEQIYRAEPSGINIYIDNGTKEPGEGYFAIGSRHLVYMLHQKGWAPEENLFYFEDLGAYHNERAWNLRVNNPLLLFQPTTRTIETTLRAPRNHRLIGWDPLVTQTQLISAENGLRLTRFPMATEGEWVLSMPKDYRSPSSSYLRIPVAKGFEDLRWERFRSPIQAKLIGQNWLSWEWYKKKPPYPINEAVRTLVIDRLMEVLEAESFTELWQEEAFAAALEAQDSVSFYHALIAILEPLKEHAHFIDFGGFYPIQQQLDYYHRILGEPQVTLPEFTYWPPGISAQKDRERSQGDEEILLRAKNRLAREGRIIQLPDLSLMVLKEK
jgi:predicted alpha/beta superfamily hydrolase